MVKAIVAHGTGGPEVLELGELERPALTEGQVRVAVRYASVNFWDVMQRKGAVPLSEHSVPGVEGVGEIVEAGPGVPAKRVGERVGWSKIPGSYAEEVVGDADWFVRLPADLPDTVAARLIMQGVTAQYLAESAWPLGSGEVAIVHAAAGGVGTLLTQFLTARNARVIGVVSREEKVAAAKEAGADNVVVMSDSFVDDVRGLVPDGVHAVFDANGGPESLWGFDVLRPRGALVLYGTANGAIPALDPARLAAGSFFVTRTAGRNYAQTRQEWRSRVDDLLARATAGRLSALDGGTWTLEQAAQVHQHLESRNSTGKLMLTVAEHPFSSDSTA